MFPALHDVLAGVIGGIIVALIGWGLTVAKQLYEKKKFPIEGEYLTYFEDMEDGQPVMVTSLTSIKQKGTRIIGKNTLPDGRSWTIDGNIVGTGHVAGVYSADATYDDGVGSFYLKINGDNLDGMWSGYDNENKTTASGRYFFKKKAQITISEATEADIPSILNLSIPLFGEGYIKDVSDYINSQDGAAFVARENDKVVGYALAKRCEKNDLRNLFGEDEKISVDITHADKAGYLGVIKTIGVSPQRQGHGIGEALFKEAESRLKEKGVKIIVVPGWVDNGKTNIDGLMKHFDYSPFMFDPEYWKARCEQEEFQCPNKKGTACVCGIKFYKKSL
ncbi:GNAT family N-acetyltransferase [Methylophaga lonarensis]|uniref:GNAT family N-acetyltransferase n=1 Tax=Methylophaga lonarensis TaxID=999151 RepID=UPI003D2CE40E